MLVCSAARMNEKETERAFARPLIQPEKIIRAEWYKSSSLDENIIETSTVKIIPVPDNKFEIISFCYRHISVGTRIYVCICVYDCELTIGIVLGLVVGSE